MWGRRLIENVIWREGWLKTSEYRHIREVGVKNRHSVYLNVPFIEIYTEAKFYASSTHGYHRKRF